MANEPGIMLTGDFVFVGDLGRPDLLDEAIVTHCQTCPRSAVVASMLGASGFEGVAELDGRRFRGGTEGLCLISQNAVEWAWGKSLAHSTVVSAQRVLDRRHRHHLKRYSHIL